MRASALARPKKASRARPSDPQIPACFGFGSSGLSEHPLATANAGASDGARGLAGGLKHSSKGSNTQNRDRVELGFAAVITGIEQPGHLSSNCQGLSLSPHGAGAWGLPLGPDAVLGTSQVQHTDVYPSPSPKIKATKGENCNKKNSAGGLE